MGYFLLEFLCAETFDVGDWILGEDERRDLLMCPLEVDDISQAPSPSSPYPASTRCTCRCPTCLSIVLIDLNRSCATQADIPAGAGAVRRPLLTQITESIVFGVTSHLAPRTSSRPYRRDELLPHSLGDPIRHHPNHYYRLHLEYPHRHHHWLSVYHAGRLRSRHHHAHQRITLLDPSPGTNRGNVGGPPADALLPLQPGYFASDLKRGGSRSCGAAGRSQLEQRRQHDRSCVLRLGGVGASIGGCDESRANKFRFCGGGTAGTGGF